MPSDEYEVKRSELKDFEPVLKPGVSCRVIVTGDPCVEVYFIEIGDTLLRFNSAVLLPTETTPPADGVSRPGLSVIAACIDYAAKHKEKKMLIAGYTDTVGSDEANVRLSRIRAEAVHGMITGARDQFATACWGPHLTDEQRYPDGGSGKKRGVLWDDYIDVLNWAAKEFGWPCGYPEGNVTLWAATVAFQKSYNKSVIGEAGNKPIPEYGSFDKKTWGAVYDCYDVKLAELLKTDKNGLDALRGGLNFVNNDPEKHIVACGEFKPVEEKERDNYRSQTNRRVEVLFFEEKEYPKVPCFSGGCSPGICPLGTLTYLPVPVGTEEGEIRIVFLKSKELPIAEAKAILSDEAGRVISNEKVTDSKGSVSWKVPHRRFFVELKKGNHHVKTEVPVLDDTGSAECSIVLSPAAFNIHIQYVDSVKKPLSGAICWLVDSEGNTISDQKVTDANGKVRWDEVREDSYVEIRHAGKWLRSPVCFHESGGPGESSIIVEPEEIAV
ncbi:MAG: hypothetical protein JXA71_15195 [Chitinispirillaceae bacterium]|nr:hypothetical protein [Chitinispirillaceae bacterium]